MDLNHIAGELTAKLVDNIECHIDLVNGTGDTSIKDGESLIRTTLESVQAETVRRTLERAAKAAPVLPSNWADWPSDRAIAFVRGWKAKHAAILALIDKPAPHDLLLVALAGFFKAVWTGNGNAARVWVNAAKELKLISETDDKTGLELTEAGAAAIALAEGAR